MQLKLLSLFALLILTTSCQRHYLKKEPTAISIPHATALEFAHAHLPKEGKLVQQADGYAYVKVDDRYIHDLFPLLSIPGFEKPHYFRRPDAPGAHISVFYENEHVKIKESGQTFNFSLRNIVEVQAGKDKAYIVLVVDAPDLEKLRQKYGLRPKLNGHEFHITIAKSKNS